MCCSIRARTSQVCCMYTYIPVLNYMARFSSDSQRESRHHFDETINNVVLYSAVVGRVDIIERRVLLETSVQFFFSYLSWPPCRLLIDRAIYSHQHAHTFIPVINSATLEYNELTSLECA